MDLKERFTEMREMDLQVQNSIDNIDEKVKKFFEGSAVKKFKPEVKQQQYEQLRKEYYKVLEEADEKVQLANQIYDLVERYLRKLDQEVSRFKMELEADHAGITEVLERRSLELDRPPKTGSTKGEKRKQPTENSATDKRIHTERLLSNLATEAAQEISGMKSSTASSSSSSTSNESTGISMSYTLGRVGAGSNNAIAMAAARAVTNTLQMQQGRRTASMKASYEAVKATGMVGLGALHNEFTFGGGSTSTARESQGQPGSTPSASSTSRSQSRRKTVSSRHNVTTAGAVTPPTPTPSTEEATPEAPADETSAPVDWSYDPNEPRYCLCNQVSYGNMVGCDNPNCPIEWFHYGCVGITQPPKGKWFCPQCTAAMKRREKKDVPSKHK
ncbi:inhibitor of growth protein 3-like isoform X2 [Apostichopus japonicus]